MLKKKILVLIVFVVTVGCGIKGPPLPPINEETIQKQKASEAVSGDVTGARPQEKK